MNKIIKPGMVVVILAFLVLAWLFTFSPFAKQNRLENKLQKEMNSIQLPTGMQLQRKEDTGDVLLGSESDWGIYFIYACTGNAAADQEAFNKALVNAGYTTTLKKNLVLGTNEAKSISISASICDETSFGSTRILMKEQ